MYKTLLKKLVYWSYRTEFYPKWMTTQFYFIIPFAFVIIIVNPLNIFFDLFEKNILFSISYYISLIGINLNSIYLLLVSHKRNIILKEYNDFILTQTKVICCWKDKELEKNKVYEVETNEWVHILKGTDFILSKFNYRSLKLVSLKEQRKLKLQKLR